jgi:Zn-dependent protease with chaperone function
MIQVLMIMVFAAMHLAEDVEAWRLVAWPAWATAAAAIGPLAIMAGIASIVCSRAGRLMDQRGSAASFMAADALCARFRLLGLGWYLLAMLAGGWAGVAASLGHELVLVKEALIVGPPMLLLASLWWSLHPLEARVREAMIFRQLETGAPIYEIPTRVQFVWGHIRHNVLIVVMPILLVSLWDDLLDLLNRHVTSASWAACEPTLRWLGVIVVFVSSPVVIMRLWSTIRIADGPLVAMLVEMCTRHRVRIRGPFLWRTHGSMVNGAVLGAFWPMRYLLLTDALLERLDAVQVEGVLAHEVAHVKRRHLVWLGVCVVAAVLATAWLIAVAAFFAGIDPQSEGTGVIASAAGLIVAVLVFGFVSRRFEWQADAFAASHLSVSRQSSFVTDFGAAAMESALARVAELNGVSTRAFSFRHGSIGERQRRLRELVGLSVDALPIDRRVRLIKWAGAVVLVLGGLPLLWEWWSGTRLPI